MTDHCCGDCKYAKNIFGDYFCHKWLVWVEEKCDAYTPKQKPPKRQKMWEIGEHLG